MTRALWVSVLVVLVAGAAGCRTGGPADMAEPAVAFRTGDVSITTGADTFALRVEIAETSRQQQTGLTSRSALPEDEGMIFLFTDPQPPGSGFWMYRTRVPLSIAFLDADGVIRRILDMVPCSSPISFFCRRYRAGVPYHAALEVSRGYFRSRGIGPGARVVLRRDPPAPSSAGEPPRLR